MYRRQLLFLTLGLVIGLAVGLLLPALSQDVRDLYGMSGSGKDKDRLEYYLVKLEHAESWLGERFPDNEEKFQASFKVLAEAPEQWKALSTVETFEEDVDTVLRHVYASLTDQQETDIAKVKAVKDAKITACLGIDDNPYGASVMYLYLELPASKAKGLEILQEAEKLKRPKTNAINWKLVACFPELASD